MPSSPSEGAVPADPSEQTGLSPGRLNSRPQRGGGPPGPVSWKPQLWPGRHGFQAGAHLSCLAEVGGVGGQGPLSLAPQRWGQACPCEGTVRGRSSPQLCSPHVVTVLLGVRVGTPTASVAVNIPCTAGVYRAAGRAALGPSPSAPAEPPALPGLLGPCEGDGATAESPSGLCGPRVGPL